MAAENEALKSEVASLQTVRRRRVSRRPFATTRVPWKHRYYLGNVDTTLKKRRYYLGNVDTTLEIRRYYLGKT